MEVPGRKTGDSEEGMTEKKDIMESILGADDQEFAGKTRELDCLIYRNDPGTEESRVQETPGSPSSWKVSKGPVTVETWEGKAKIKIKVASGAASHMSMRRIASIAVDAIMAEIEKERS